MNNLPTHDVAMRWRDIDGLGHVSHTAVLTYLEEGRDAYLAGLEVGRFEYVVGSCSVTFNEEIKFAWREVAVSCRIQKFGRSSFTTTEKILNSRGEVAVEAEFALVMWDPELSGSKPINGQQRETFMLEVEAGT